LRRVLPLSACHFGTTFKCIWRKPGKNKTALLRQSKASAPAASIASGVLVSSSAPNAKEKSQPVFDDNRGGGSASAGKTTLPRPAIPVLHTLSASSAYDSMLSATGATAADSYYTPPYPTTTAMARPMSVGGTVPTSAPDPIAPAGIRTIRHSLSSAAATDTTGIAISPNSSATGANISGTIDDGDDVLAPDEVRVVVKVPKNRPGADEWAEL
jgi:hypothetical protein